MNKRALATFGLALLVAVVPLTAKSSGTPIYLDTSYSPAERAADLVGQMTLSEKASQAISNMAPAISRLGIPAYGWWNEAAHGVSCETLSNNSNCTPLTNTTSYPVALAGASTWNPPLLNAEATLISDEAREVETNNTLNMDFYAPVVNMIRDPRWGRTDETFSEDPLLMSKMAGQFVNGLQGQDVNGNLRPEGGGYLKAISTVKHYALNNSEVDRRSGSANADDRTIREYYTKQYRDIVQEAHAGSVMSSYNRVNGVPAPASVYLIDTLLRETFGFGGYLTSDCDAIYEIQAGHHWQPPGYSAPVNDVQRHALAMSAGEDLNCNTGYHDSANYANRLVPAVQQKVPTLVDTFNENDVDTSLVRLFTARMKLGEFDNGGDSVPWVQAARSRVPKGSWANNDTNNAVTETPERLAMAQKVGDESIVLLKNSGKVLPLKVPGSGLYKVAVIGSYANPTSMYLGDYSSSQSAHGQLNEVNGFQGLKAAITAIDPEAQVDWFPGTVGGNVDPASVNAAAAYDAVVVYVGTDSSTSSEDNDRETLALPGNQASLISQVAAKNPNTIVYMETCGPVELGSFQDAVPAMLWSSFNGMRKGASLADVVTGAVNPSGHLPFTWYRQTSDLPPMSDYAIRPHGTIPGRTYMYYTGPVSYPFGHGLSYTTFNISSLTVDKASPNAGDTITVSALVTNTGNTLGSEVVQLYASQPDAAASLERPIRRLVDFRKVSLHPGESQQVNFRLQIPKLAFFDQTAKAWKVDTGKYLLAAGDSSDPATQTARGTITVNGSLKRVPAVLTVKPTMQGDAANDIVQRVFFPVGATVLPNPTVAMNDDTLYGYITKGQSVKFPDMKFAYTSNRPAVVSVKDGVIKTVGTGVATVTATVTYAGTTKTTPFVVYVR